MLNVLNQDLLCAGKYWDLYYWGAGVLTLLSPQIALYNLLNFNIAIPIMIGYFLQFEAL